MSWLELKIDTSAISCVFSLSYHPALSQGFHEAQWLYQCGRKCVYCLCYGPEHVYSTTPIWRAWCSAQRYLIVILQCGVGFLCLSCLILYRGEGLIDNLLTPLIAYHCSVIFSLPRHCSLLTAAPLLTTFIHHFHPGYKSLDLQKTFKVLTQPLLLHRPSKVSKITHFDFSYQLSKL